MGRLEGRVALITGASSGLGRAFRGGVRARGRAGRDRGAAGRQGAGARRAGWASAALPVAIDVTDEGSIIAAYDVAEAAFGTVDTIVANAGQSNPGRATGLSNADLRATIDVNFTGVFLTAREGAKRLIAAGARERGHGRVILLGSITAHMTAQGDSAYAASKAAVAHLGRNLAREWVRAGVNVNVIQPGYIRTGINGDWFDTAGGEQQIAGWHRRRLMPLDALDETLLYLASDASAHVTGAVIDVDDGQSL